MNRSEQEERFRPMELKLFRILSDGKPHRLDELRQCCAPSGLSALRMQITSIRKKIRYDGMNVVGQNGYYQLVRMLDQSE